MENVERFPLGGSFTLSRIVFRLLRITFPFQCVPPAKG